VGHVDPTLSHKCVRSVGGDHERRVGRPHSDHDSGSAITLTAPVSGPGQLAPSWNLDGVYLWLGPTGAASYVDTTWDSTFGGDATVVRVREQRLISVLGGTLGASRWTERGGGRVWIDALAGTRIGASRMIGVSLGPIVELSDFAHPRYGASAGVWAFAGVTPFARVGSVEKLGTFAEIGLHITLPVLRWRSY
jgi:hypothetical protein